MAKSYTDLEVYQESFRLFVEIHKLSHRLPKYELYEQGSQIRRSADSINSNIVEGYGRKSYKHDFCQFLIYARASNDETVNHLRKIAAVRPNLIDATTKLLEDYDKLGAKLYKFHQYVQQNWR